MGCWNETCGITNLPILAGNKVKLFVLRGGGHARREGGGTCYINEIWAPIAPPITGEYNDYGGIENIVEGKNATLLLQQIRENWAPVEEDRYHDKVIPPEEMDLERALHYIERDYVKPTNYHGESESLGIMFILDEVYQEIIKYDPICADHEAERYVYRPYSQGMTREIKEWYEKGLEKYAKAKGDPDELSYLKVSLHIDGDRLFYDYKNKAGRALKKIFQELMQQGLTWDTPEVQDIANMALDMCKLEHAMTAARKMWAPQTGKGGQHSELDVYKLINKASDQVIQARDKEGDGCYEADENGYYPYMLEHNKEVENVSNE